MKNVITFTGFTQGEMMWPPPPPKEVPAAAAPPPKVAKEPPPPPDPFSDTMKETLVYTAGFGSVLGSFSFKFFFQYLLLSTHLLPPFFFIL